MLYQNAALRKLVLPLMRRFNFDFTTDHHWLPGARIHLNFFQHKGYWYHGRSRERETMDAFRRLIPSGATVIEVGGHIGYISMYFASLTGPKGQVFVFEPGGNNQKYLQSNIAELPNVEWIDRAASDKTGTVSFYCDNLTGQNNSLVADFEVAEKNASLTGIALERAEVKVEATTLDAFCAERGIAPDFVKIDVEGAELLVVRGMKSVLRSARPRLMVEKNDEKDDALGQELAAEGYVFLSPDLQLSADGHMHLGNNFCIHSGDSILSEIKAL